MLFFFSFCSYVLLYTVSKTHIEKKKNQNKTKLKKKQNKTKK